MKKSFKEKFPYKKRADDAKRIKIKYPDRVPVIVEKASSANIPEVDKHKYLVPKDLSISQFIYVIRKRINLTPEQSIFVFVNNTIPPAASLMSQLYHEQADNDGFLYVSYSGENTFG